MHLQECREGPRISGRSADGNKHCQMKLRRTSCIGILSPQLDCFSPLLISNPRLLHGFLFLESSLWNAVTSSMMA